MATTYREAEDEHRCLNVYDMQSDIPIRCVEAGVPQTAEHACAFYCNICPSFHLLKVDTLQI